MWLTEDAIAFAPGSLFSKSEVLCQAEHVQNMGSCVINAEFGWKRLKSMYWAGRRVVFRNSDKSTFC
jgi:hypothetical protein